MCLCLATSGCSISLVCPQVVKFRCLLCLQFFTLIIRWAVPLRLKISKLPAMYNLKRALGKPNCLGPQNEQLLQGFRRPSQKKKLDFSEAWSQQKTSPVVVPCFQCLNMWDVAGECLALQDFPNLSLSMMKSKCESWQRCCSSNMSKCQRSLAKELEGVIVLEVLHIPYGINDIKLNDINMHKPLTLNSFNSFNTLESLARPHISAILCWAAPVRWHLAGC